MVVTRTDTAAWIEAISTLVIGVLGVVITCFQFWANGFRVKAVAEIEPRNDALRVRLKNRDRGSGTITNVVVMTPPGLITPATAS